MRWHIILIIVFFLLLSGAAIFLLNTPYALSYFVPRYVKSSFIGIDVERFTAARQIYRFPDELELQDCRMALRWGQKNLQLSSPRILLHDVLKLWKRDKKVKLSVENMAVEEKDLAAHGLALKAIVDFKKAPAFELRGLMRAQRIRFRYFHAEELSAQIDASSKQWDFIDMGFLGYGGAAEGQLTFTLEPVFSVIAWAEFKDMEPGTLREIHPGFFAQIDGKLDGTLRMVIREGRFDLLTIKLAMSSGEIKAPLVRHIISVMRDVGQKTKLEEWINSREGLRVEPADFLLEQNPGRTQVIFSLRDRDGKFHIKENLYANIETGLEGIFTQNE